MKGLATSGLAILLGSCATVAPADVDLLISGGTIYPGGASPFVGDVAVRGDRIVAVGPNLRVRASRRIDARGMIVAPGFIDPHAHMIEWLTDADAKRRLVAPFLLQGVTTAFVGNDGGGPIEVANLLAGVRDKPVGINFATFTGFGTIREKVIGQERRAPTAEELAREQALVRSAMCQGALGLSTGLFYAPQSFSKTPEVIALAKVAGDLGGVYDTHLRDEANYTVGLAAAVDETIEIARNARIPVHISHIKALGVEAHGMAPAIIAKVDAARAAGLSVTASQYPWEASGTSMIAALVPLWAQDGGFAKLGERLDDPAESARIREGVVDNMRRRGGPERLLVVQGPHQGKRLTQVAAELRLAPADAALAVIREGDVRVVSFNMAEADIAAFMRQSWTMTTSDASAGHPRVFGSFARKYATYVRDRQTISLPEFIDRSTSLTADWFGLPGRGRLRAGSFADVVVFNPDQYRERATYDAPEETAVGVQAVVVNGTLAVENGALTGAASGRALARTPPPGKCPV